MAGCPPAKKKQLEAAFKKLDANGDNSLDIEELGTLLKKGNPNMSDTEIQALYDSCDANGDGRVEFGEFLAYIYGQERSAHAADRKGGRHDRLAKGSGAPKDEDEGITENDWVGTKHTFQAYSDPLGKNPSGPFDMDNKEFAKLCKDVKFVGHGMMKTDVDMIFTKVVPKGKRRLDFAMFQECVRHIAGKRNQSIMEMIECVAASSGPVLHGTKTEYSKFYDDKSTYTGAATANSNLAGEGLDPNHGGDRHAAQQAAMAEQSAAQAAEEGDWGECQRVFSAFAGDSCDGREFLKFCGDCKLLSKSFNKQDVDVTFTAVCRKAKQMDFEMFKEAVKKISVKRKESVYQTQSKIAEAEGPSKTGVTKLDAVRFYDDKDTYTGAAGNVFGREGMDERDTGHADNQAKQDALKRGEGLEEGDWTEALACFEVWGGDNGIDSKEFTKLLKQAGVYDKKYTTIQSDIDFTSAERDSPMKRKLDAETFKIVIRLASIKKGCTVTQMQEMIASQIGGPTFANASEVVGSRFYDDKDTWTGTATELDIAQ